MSRTETTSPSPYRPQDPTAVLERLHDINDRLTDADLTPSPETTAAFEELVALCATADEHTTRAILARPGTEGLLRSLREMSARGETELERSWAREVSTASDPWAALERFPYLANYRALVRAEIAGLSAAGLPAPRTVAVLGSGPLPLTGIVLARDHGTGVLNIDRDHHAYALGSDVVSALSLSDLVRTVRSGAAEAAARADLATVDLVVLAALVGETSAEKRPVLDMLAEKLRPDAALVIRSAHRLRTALYPQVSPDDLGGFLPLLEIRPYGDIINSILIARPTVR